MKVPIWLTMRVRFFLCRSVLLVVVPLVQFPMHLSAENGLASADKGSALIQGREGSQSGIAHEVDTQTPALALDRAREDSIAGTSLPLAPTTVGWLSASEVARQRAPRVFAKPVFQPPQQQGAERKRGWIARHPALFGALVGFGGGFLIGYASGEDGIIYDYSALGNGVILGGVGAGAGAAVGAIIGAVRK